jgi:hypothetical protein
MILLAFLLAADGGVQYVYHCRNVADQSRFALVFERRGESLRDVTVGHDALPRLGGDVRTRWRGTMVGEEALFRLSENRRHTSLSGEMRLSPIAGRDHNYRLVWSSRLAGGHVQMETEEQAAECTVPEFARGRE